MTSHGCLKLSSTLSLANKANFFIGTPYRSVESQFNTNAVMANVKNWIT